MATEIPWHTDTSGMLIGSRTHDGYLFALSYSDGEDLRLRVRRISGEIVDIELGRVGDTGIVGFCNGAIFGELFVWKLGELDANRLSRMHTEVLTLFGNDLDVATARSQVAKLVQSSPDLLLVFASCSFGGQIAAICERVRIFEATTP